MLRHIATLLWNTRRTRLLLALQIMLSFLVLFGVFSFVAEKFDAYRTPLGFEVADAYQVDLQYPVAIDTTVEERAAMLERIRREVEAMPDVERASALGPFGMFDNSMWSWGEEVDGAHIQSALFIADQHFAEAAGLNLSRGRWYTPEDTLNGGWPIVVNQAWMDENYPHSDVLNTVINYFQQDGVSRTTRVIGVVESFKYLGEFAEEAPTAFVSDVPWNIGRVDHYFNGLLVRARRGAPARLEQDIFDRIKEVMGNSESTVTSVEARRQVTSKSHWVPIVLTLTIAGFLVINVALGLFGLLINAIAKRRGEIGLRRALGATGGGVTRQLMLEVLLVVLLGILVGALLGAQLVYLQVLSIDNEYLAFGALCSFAFILLITWVCALIPSAQAARIHPAIALRED